jgi:superfamily I DNA/RNA helicase
VRILREEAAALGYKPNFSILDATDCFGIVAELGRQRRQGHHPPPAGADLELEECAGVARPGAQATRRTKAKPRRERLRQLFAATCRPTRRSISMT